jgi:putative spermidine/putrescine transport system ATP-binding protein/mannopine transport system ATP-binding protein
MTTSVIPAQKGRAHGLRGGSVQVENIVRHYGAVKALDHVLIDVVPGEFLALLGPSGSGKTTLLMTIAGFETPTSGRIRIDGQDVTHTPPNKRNLGMVFQRYALFPHMSLRDNVGFPLRMRGVAKAERDARADGVLATVGLAGYGDRLPSQLSGGQQQRVALARAIVYEPPVLLMDEPLSALDKNLREQMRLEIKHLQKSLGITVIFVTHDQEEALVMADRIAVMDKGKLVQVGGPQELYERPGNEFVAGFLGETNFIDGDIVARDGEMVRLKLASGATIHGSTTSEANNGARARISVRPESISVSVDKISADGMEGRLKELIYAGSSMIALVDVGLPQPINIRKTSTMELGGRAEGDKVWLSWRAQDGRAFPLDT